LSTKKLLENVYVVKGKSRSSTFIKIGTESGMKGMICEDWCVNSIPNKTVKRTRIGRKEIHK